MSSNATGKFAPGSTMPSQPGAYKIIMRLGEPSDEGEVYRASYRKILDCAIKFVEPERVETAVIENEVKLLSLLRHTHLVRITDFGTGAPQLDEQQRIFADPKQCFYIVMELVPGKPINEAWKEVGGPGLLRLLDQLLDAVVYLHERGVLHMDLKPKNVLVEESNRNVVIIDLGFSVVADPDSFRKVFQLAQTEEGSVINTNDVYAGSEEVYVASTREYTRPIRLELLGRKVPRRTIRDEWFPDHDLYALGVLLDQALTGMALEKWPSIERGLGLIRDRLFSGDYYSNAADIRSDIHKLQRGYLAPLSVPELSAIPDRGMYIAQATAAIQVTDRIRRVIDHPFFQRLRYVPQLDFEQLVYPDARHSRLSHSLLTFNLTRLAIIHMLSDVGFRLAVEAEDVQGTLLFALLHDIGHYPLSHMFEDFRGKETGRNDFILLDDDLFGPLLDANGEDIIGAMIKKKLDHGQSMSSLICQLFGEPTLNALWSIAKCANASIAPLKPIHRVLSGLVSSAIDLDKVAYLLADSTMSGVNYGRGIDLQGFFTSLVNPLAIDSSSKENVTGQVLGIDEKGLAAAESIILARYWMLSRVYWHHTNRAIMAAFKFAISELVSAGKLDFSKYLSEVFWSGEVEALKYLSKEFSATWKKEKVNPLDGLMNGRRGIYKRLITISHQQEEDLYNKLINRDDTAATNAATRALESILPNDNVKRGVIIVDIPRRTRDTIRLEEIRILGDPEAGERVNNRSLHEASPLLTNLHDEFLNEVKKSRIFIHPATYETLKSQSKLEQAREEVRRELSTKLK